MPEYLREVGRNSGLRDVAERGMLASMADEKTVLIVVTMRITCGCGCAHAEEFSFDMEHDKAQPMEAYEPGTCPDCGIPTRIHLKRTSALQQ